MAGPIPGHDDERRRFVMRALVASTRAFRSTACPTNVDGPAQGSLSAGMTKR